MPEKENPQMQFPLGLPEPTERISEDDIEEFEELQASYDNPPNEDIELGPHPIWGKVGGRNSKSEGNR